MRAAPSLIAATAAICANERVAAIAERDQLPVAAPQLPHGFEQVRDLFFPQQAFFGRGGIHRHVPQCFECGGPSRPRATEMVAQGVPGDREDPHPRFGAAWVVAIFSLKGAEKDVGSQVVRRVSRIDVKSEVAVHRTPVRRIPGGTVTSRAGIIDGSASP